MTYKVVNGVRSDGSGGGSGGGGGSAIDPISVFPANVGGDNVLVKARYTGSAWSFTRLDTGAAVTETAMGAATTSGSTPDAASFKVLNKTTSGTIPAGAMYVSILNVGDADGIVMGVSVAPGLGAGDLQHKQANGLLGAITYDATGTQFFILVTGTTAYLAGVS